MSFVLVEGLKITLELSPLSTSALLSENLIIAL